MPQKTLTITSTVIVLLIVWFVALVPIPTAFQMVILRTLVSISVACLVTYLAMIKHNRLFNLIIFITTFCLIYLL